MIGVFRKPWHHWMAQRDRRNALLVATPPTLPVTDNFNRADSDPIGGNWTTVTSEGSLKIATNAGAPSNVGNDSGAWYNAVTWPADQYSQCKVTVSGTGADTGIGPSVRVASGARTYYRLVISSAATLNATLGKVVTGTYTQLWQRTVTFVNGDLIRLEVQGTTLRGYRNGVQIGADFTDSAIATGNAGIGYSSASTSASVDDWEGGDLTVVAAVSYTPPRLPQFRRPGDTWWIQKDRRDANLVSTAANPLAPPLDSAWQSGATYWHLYNDSADAALRTWQPQQRVYTDPNLFAPAVDIPSANPPDPANYTDRRLIPQQRPYVSDPNLLAPAATDPLGMPAGPAGDVASYWDRREVPQQPVRVSDPALLASALLENELLGGADTTKRYTTPATHTPRTWVPRQPRREAFSPGLLDTAELENELLGGAETAKRANVPATHVDRREVSQQPARLADQSVTPVAFDPTTAGWPPNWLAHNQAALDVDRREVPQQRPYISDPSFYPTTAPTDPLTLAFGAGGSYWWLYNTATAQVSRRLVPQQRAYVSDPALLASALLEDALLGGADDRTRHILAASYWDRCEVPAQRVYFGPPTTALLEDVLLGGADDRQRHYFATYWRTVPPGQQPRYPAPLALVADPLLVGAGVGGDAWRRTNTAATNAPRVWRPQQAPRWYLPGVPVAIFNALSAPLVSAAYASAPVTSAGRTSAPGVTGSRTSAPTVGGSSGSNPTVTGKGSSSPSVSDG